MNNANSQKDENAGLWVWYLINSSMEFIVDKKYFDFGISSKNNGLVLNEGLIAQKESFGARVVAHSVFVINDFVASTSIYNCCWGGGISP